MAGGVWSSVSDQSLAAIPSCWDVATGTGFSVSDQSLAAIPSSLIFGSSTDFECIRSEPSRYSQLR